MDREARSNLRKFVTQARQLLEEDIRIQLKRLGIEEGGKTVPAGRLSHLRREDKDLRDKILVAIEKEQVRMVKRSEAYDRYVRHVGFTYLNRLAALRAMEVRELIKETVVRGDQYAGMSRREYELSEKEGLSDRAEITKKSLLEAFNEVSQEIRVLFDVNDEYSLLFPSPRTLYKLMRLLGEEVPEENWLEEEIIGWIYQYYNSEARSEFRKKWRKPRPDDVPVINQFYTPRWLVRALVDNTLGRLWLEMKGGMPKPGQAEASSEERLRNPQGETLDEYCSYLIPLRQDSPPRGKKNVREIKVLDPACGSGHFLVYAFNVLYRMYLEDEPETPREDIPRLILENNLFGIDIDLRSVQLAALSLFLKAKECNRDVKVGRMNLVCADVRITDGDLQREFISRLEPDVDLQRIFVKLFKELEFTYDVGSLLKVRAPFKRLLEERRKGVQTRFQPRIAGQSILSRKGVIEGQSELSIEEAKQGVLVKPVVTLKEMLDALLEFEREGMEKKDMGTMLFTAEAEKSVGLLYLLSQKYDVVVMNPPYGKMPQTTKKYLSEHYPRTHSDYYTAFIEQAIDLCGLDGCVGALTGRTFMFLKSHQKLREEILRHNALPEVVLDLGFNVLDEATARYAAFTLRNRSPKHKIDWGKHAVTFLKLTDYKWDEKRVRFEESLSGMKTKESVIVGSVFTVKLGELADVPGTPYSYWAPKSLRILFQNYPPLDRDVARQKKKRKIADAKVGLQTSDYPRFTRFWWEVDINNIAVAKEETHHKKWVPFNKGGKPFYFDIVYLVNWSNNGDEIRNFEKAVIRNEKFYFHKGLAWTLKLSWTETGKPARLKVFYLPDGVIFSHGSYACFLDKDEHIWPMLSLLRSNLIATLIYLLDPNIQNILVATLARVPVNPEIFQNQELFSLAKEVHCLLKEWDTGNEPSTHFVMPWILQIWQGFDPNWKPITQHPLTRDFVWSDLKEAKKIRREDQRWEKKSGILPLVNECVEQEKALRKRIEQIRKEIDEKVYSIYGISDEDKVLIEHELFHYPDNRKSEVDIIISAEEHVKRLLSHYVKKAMNSDVDGIVPIEEIAQKIREHIKEDFREQQKERVESEIAQMLGKNLIQWLVEDYFTFHVGLYERRPIIWHMTSANFSPRKRSQGAFNCFLHYHKLRKDTIFKIRTRDEYLKGALRGVKWKTQRLRRELQEARDSGDKRRERQLQEEYEKSLEELNELQAFDNKLAEVSNPRDKPTQLDEDASWAEEKIAEVRDNGWSPVLDYGVRVNIEPLKEAGLLHRAADRVK